MVDVDADQRLYASSKLENCSRSRSGLAVDVLLPIEYLRRKFPPEHSEFVVVYGLHDSVDFSARHVSDAGSCGRIAYFRPIDVREPQRTANLVGSDVHVSTLIPPRYGRDAPNGLALPSLYVRQSSPIVFANHRSWLPIVTLLMIWYSCKPYKLPSRP